MTANPAIVHVVHDLLDKSVVDRNGREMGRIDAIVLAKDDTKDDGPPRIEALLIGPSALGSRIHPALGRLMHAIERRLGVARDRPSVIHTNDIDQIDRKIRLRLTIGDTSVGAIEQLMRRWIVKLPGSR